MMKLGPRQWSARWHTDGKSTIYNSRKAAIRAIEERSKGELSGQEHLGWPICPGCGQRCEVGKGWYAITELVWVCRNHGREQSVLWASSGRHQGWYKYEFGSYASIEAPPPTLSPADALQQQLPVWPLQMDGFSRLTSRLSRDPNRSLAPP